MIQASLDAGALGAKINGSGGGGCMFAYAPQEPEKVVEAIEKEGGKAYIIRVDEGTKTERESLFY
jgi:galactokinase